MRSVTPTVENETLDKLLCSWAMWVLSPHALFDDTNKEKWENAKKKVASENPQAFIDKHGGSRLWNLSPNSFVRYANHVFTLLACTTGKDTGYHSRLNVRANGAMYDIRLPIRVVANLKEGAIDAFRVAAVWSKSSGKVRLLLSTTGGGGGGNGAFLTPSWCCKVLGGSLSPMNNVWLAQGFRHRHLWSWGDGAWSLERIAHSLCPHHYQEPGRHVAGRQGAFPIRCVSVLW